MIVECGNCETRFQLDESRVPLRGIQVRCSRCKEAFFLRHPDASGSEAVHDVADAAARQPSSVPDSARDLPRSPGAGDHGDSEEDDWEFNQEPARRDPNDDSIPDFDIRHARDEGPNVGLEDDSSEPGLGIDDGDEGGVLADYDAEAESGLDLAGESEPGAFDAREDDGPLAASTDSRSGADVGEQMVGRSDLTDFGEVSDFSALSEESGDETPTGDVPAPAPIAAREEAPSGDVGDPEDWDFFNEETLERPYPADDAMGRAMARLSADAADDVRSVGSGPIGRAPALENRSRQTAFTLVGNGIGWLVTLSLFFVGLASGIVREPASAVRTAIAVPLGGFHAENIRGYWVDTARAGRVFAVKGRLVNDGARAARPGAALQVALVAADGTRLDAPTVVAGAPLAERQLRELAPDDLAEVSRSAASQLAWGTIEPHAAREFLAVFVDLTREAHGFELALAPAAERPAEPAVSDVGSAEDAEPVRGPEAAPGEVPADTAEGATNPPSV